MTLQDLMWAQEIDMDPELARAGDFLTGEDNSRLIQFLNGGDNDVTRAWFDPFLGEGDTSSWSAHVVEPNLWRMAVMSYDHMPGTSANAVLPEVLRAAGVAPDHQGIVFDDDLVHHLAGKPFDATRWLTVIEQLRLQPVGVQVVTTVSGGSPAPGRLANEWVPEEGADRELSVRVTNVGTEAERDVRLYISDDGNDLHASRRRPRPGEARWFLDNRW